jgi:hypothetical protein
MVRRLIFVSLAAMALGGCNESTSPSLLPDAYALARIGVQTPPIPQGPSGGAPFLIADTLRLDHGRPREDLGWVLTRILVVRDDNGTDYRMESEHIFTIEGSVLTYDSCPRDALCVASLVYAPLVFQIVGDSLFQIGPQASPLPASVYGAVRD